jgi:hypothetical protein
MSLTVRVAIAFVVLGATGCGFWTVQARDIVQSEAVEHLACADVVVAVAADGRYVASGCGRTQRYVCDRDIATELSKPGAIAAVGCRRDAGLHSW